MLSEISQNSQENTCVRVPSTKFIKYMEFCDDTDKILYYHIRVIQYLVKTKIMIKSCKLYFCKMFIRKKYIPRDEISEPSKQINVNVYVI